MHRLESSPSTRADPRTGFIKDAVDAREHALISDEVYEAAEVHAWLKARVSDGKRERPQAQPWRRG